MRSLRHGRVWRTYVLESLAVKLTSAPGQFDLPKDSEEAILDIATARLYVIEQVHLFYSGLTTKS